MLRRLQDYLDIYLVNGKTAIIGQFQYRMANLLWMVGMFAEPVIYLVVWSTIAEAQGGEVGGYTAGAFAAYYITWTMVRHFNIGLTPYDFEHRIKDGRLSGELLRPIHPFHFDLGYFLGWKIPTTIYWIPIGIALTLVFKPELNPAPWEVAAFCVALVTGFIMRFTLLWALGLITFWTTRVSAIFDVYFTAELLLSGRLVPLSLMPAWAQTAANWLPFQWAFAFPIELLLGRLTPREVLIGFGAQALWFAVGVLAVNWLWRNGVRKYSAVGA
jgi:ABC-2 type transport system permease protein